MNSIVYFFCLGENGVPDCTGGRGGVVSGTGEAESPRGWIHKAFFSLCSYHPLVVVPLGSTRHIVSK